MASPQLPGAKVGRRRFIKQSLGSTLAIGSLAGISTMSEHSEAESILTGPIIDTHMHVWADDLKRFPFRHPYNNDFQNAAHPGSVEMLIDDMDRHDCTHAVLVQVIYHGWDNSYIADCVKRFPQRLKAHGLIDPTDPQVADKLEYWVEEHGLKGMRFSPIYYQNGNHGGDSWLNADSTHRLWKKAEQLDAVFNFFIAPAQLLKLEKMVRAHPGVPVIIDHLSQIDMSAKDAEHQLKLLLGMAEYQNVLVKVSELSSVSPREKYPFPKSYANIKRVHEAFGPRRLLFGTGYPGTARAAFKRPALDKEIDLFRSHFPFLNDEDRENILGKNAARLWGFKTTV